MKNPEKYTIKFHHLNTCQKYSKTISQRGFTLLVPSNTIKPSNRKKKRRTTKKQLKS